MTAITGEMLALVAADVPAIEVGPGCRRRDLPSAAGVRAWIVEMAPGSCWPHVDAHPTGEDVYVLEGEMIEGEQHYPAGSYLHFLPGSSHRSEEHTSELQSLMRISYAVFCLKKKNKLNKYPNDTTQLHTT